MKIKINDKEIELTEEQIKILKEEVNSEKRGFWKPGIGELVWAIDVESVNGVCSFVWDGSKRYYDLYTLGDIYKTEKLAIEAFNKLKAIQRVKGYIAEYCEVVEDVGNSDTKKWSIVYDMQSNNFFADGGYLFLYCQPLPYLKTEEDAQKVLDNCEVDLKVIWGIK